MIQLTTYSINANNKEDLVLLPLKSTSIRDSEKKTILVRKRKMGMPVLCWCKYQLVQLSQRANWGSHSAKCVDFVNSWLPSYYQHNVLLGKSWIFCLPLWRGLSFWKPLAMSQKGKGKIRTYWEWKFDLRWFFQWRWGEGWHLIRIGKNCSSIIQGWWKWQGEDFEGRDSKHPTAHSIDVFHWKADGSLGGSCYEQSNHLLMQRDKQTFNQQGRAGVHCSFCYKL